MDKTKISLTVAQETIGRMDELSSQLFPHITVSRGDVVDYLVAETLRVIRERGSAVGLFPYVSEKEGPVSDWVKGEQDGLS